MVRFALDSVYLPAADAVLSSLKPADHVVGTITQFSESDAAAQAYAVVSLPGKSNFVVPVGKLVRVGRRGS
jgi:hypothetical protein